MTHREMELGVLGIVEKLVKDLVHLWRWDFDNK
jgi:hypothetical protein